MAVAGCRRSLRGRWGGYERRRGGVRAPVVCAYDRWGATGTGGALRAPPGGAEAVATGPAPERSVCHGTGAFGKRAAGAFPDL